jgi:purine-binding chemotaxis protein CheW
MKPNNVEQGHAACYLPKSLAAQKILEQRAQKLAETSTANDVDQDKNYYLRFGLGKNHYFGVDFDQVQEVIRYANISALPLAPDFVSGVMNYRGHLIAVIDLSILFSLKKASLTEDSHIIIVNVNAITVGIITSYIDNSRSYNPSSLGAPLSATNRLKSNYVVGLHNGTTAILNIAVMLQDFNNELKSRILSSRQSKV